MPPTVALAACTAELPLQGGCPHPLAASAGSPHLSLASRPGGRRFEMLRSRGWGVFIAAALGLCACVDKALAPCDPNDDTCNPPPKGNPCRIDADCGDGKCLPDGHCQAPPTTVVPSACVNVQCKSTEFCSNGLCLPANAQCKPPDPACIFIPHGSFEPPVHQWWWPWQTPDGPDDTTGHDTFRADVQYPDYMQVMSTPVVIRLKASDPSPAVVFNSFTSAGSFVVETQGVMRAVRGSDGKPLWTAPPDLFNNWQYSVNGNAQIAAGDCTGSGEVCFITGGWDPDDAPPNVTPERSHQHGGLIAFGSDGRLLWLNRNVQVWWGAPTIARLLGTPGPAQIVVGNGVFDGKTGRTLCAQTIAPGDQIGGNGDGTITAIADIDLDGVPEIVTGNQAYKLLPDAASPTGYTCKALFGEGVKMPNNQPCLGGFQSFCPNGFPAIASFAGYGAKMGLKTDDPHPQIVVASHGFLRIQDWTGGILVAPIPLPIDPTCADASEGGAPTIADFDGDGLPEVGIAAQGAYVVWKQGLNDWLWKAPTRDCSSNTGSSVFDFEGKGQANVVYSDQCNFRVYDGRTGKELVKEKNSSCTAYEMPIVADIDGTGRARVLVPNNNVCDYNCPDWPAGTSKTGQQSGSRLVGLKALASASDKWVNTLSVWNEHGYHMTNVNLDGTLPFPEVNSWAKGQSNTYRQNLQGQGEFSSPDLAICEVNVDMSTCQTQRKATVTATVYNGGALVVKAGVSVDFHVVLANGSTAHIATAFTKSALVPGASEKLTIVWNSPPESQAVTVRAVADEKNVIGACHPENRVTSSAQVRCTPLG
jgi:hypothetical protein